MMPKLSVEEEKQIQQAFFSIDEDRSGFIGTFIYCLNILLILSSIC